MCTRISGQGSSGRNKQFALDYLVSVVLRAPFKEESARGTLWETWFMYTVFVKGNLTVSYMSLFSCFIVFFFFFAFF